MPTFNIQAAKTQLSRLVEDARNGKDVILAKAGKPMVRLVPITSESGTRVSGQWQGRARIDDEFDAKDPRITAMFAGQSAKVRRR